MQNHIGLNENDNSAERHHMLNWHRHSKTTLLILKIQTPRIEKNNRTVHQTNKPFQAWL